MMFLVAAAAIVGFLALVGFLSPAALNRHLKSDGLVITRSSAFFALVLCFFVLKWGIGVIGEEKYAEPPTVSLEEEATEATTTGLKASDFLNHRYFKELTNLKVEDNIDRKYNKNIRFASDLSRGITMRFIGDPDDVEIAEIKIYSFSPDKEIQVGALSVFLQVCLPDDEVTVVNDWMKDTLMELSKTDKEIIHKQGKRSFTFSKSSEMGYIGITVK